MTAPLFASPWRRLPNGLRLQERLRLRTPLALALLALAGTLSATQIASAQAGTAGSACGMAVTTSERLAGTVARGGAHGELVLTDGTSLRPADLWIEDRDALVPEGTPVTYRRVARAPDRWGRWAARIGIATVPGSSLEYGLVAEGRALVRPETGETDCILALLAAETQARAARHGLWADGARLLPANDFAKLSQAYGTYVVAEGFVRNVGVRERLTYLNFGRRWSENLAVAMTKTLWTQAASRSITAPVLEGRRVRVRGVLERGSGPIIRIGRLDEIELLGDR